MSKILLIIFSLFLLSYSIDYRLPQAPEGELLNLCRSKGMYITSFTEFLPPEYYEEGTENRAQSIREYNFIEKNFESTLHSKFFDFHFRSTGLGTYNWDATDKICRKVDSMGFKLYLNTLIWPTTTNSPPDWLYSGGYSLPEIKSIIYAYVDTLFERYHQYFSVVEATNEICINNYIDTASWYAINWPKYYIDIHRYVSQVAHSYGVKTCLNEAIHEGGGGSNNALLKLLHEMSDSGVNIDIIGLQTHLLKYDTSRTLSEYNWSDFQNMIDSIRSIGYDSIYITELDMGVDTLFSDTLRLLKEQANQYANIFYIAYKNKIPINLWGFNNVTNWRITKKTFNFPCIWDTISNDTSYYTTYAYRAIKKLLSDSLKTEYSKNTYQIKANWFKTLKKIDNFCFYINLENIEIRKFWSLCNSSGSNIYVTDLSGDTIPIYLSKFSKHTNSGIIELTKEFSDTSYLTLNINVSETDTFNNKQDVFSSAGIVYSPDFSSITNGISDKCNNVLLDNTTNISNANLTKNGILITAACDATNTVASSKLKLSSGTISVFCTSYDSVYASGVQKRHIGIQNSSNSVYAYSAISNSYITFGGRVMSTGISNTSFIQTQLTYSGSTPELSLTQLVPILKTYAPYNHTMTWGSAQRRQMLNDLRRNIIQNGDARLTWGSDNAYVKLFSSTQDPYGEYFNIRIYDTQLSPYHITLLNQDYIDQKNFFQYPEDIQSYITVDSTYSSPSYYRYNISVNEFSDTIRVILMDSTSGSSSFSKVDSIKCYSSNAYSIFGFSKQASTSYATKILVIHENNDIDTIYGSVSTTSGTTDTLRLDTIRIRYRFSTSIPIKCYNVDINSSDSVILNASLTIRDSINISKSSTKISYNSSGKIFGWLYPSNKLYIRTNGVQSIPPVLKSSYRTWYIWR